MRQYQFLGDLDPLVCLLVGPLGFALLAQFCLFGWKAFEDKNGTGSSLLAIGIVLSFGFVGSLFTIGFVDRPVIDVLLLSAGFWMLWGFALASGIRKLLRIRREANAE